MAGGFGGEAALAATTGVAAATMMLDATAVRRSAIGTLMQFSEQQEWLG